MAETQFYTIHNMVRRPSSRLQRAASSTRHEAALWLLGKRILPKKPIQLPTDLFEANKAMIIDLVRQGRIALTTPDSTFIDSLPTGRLTYAKPGSPVIVEATEQVAVPESITELVKKAIEEKAVEVVEEIVQAPIVVKEEQTEPPKVEEPVVVSEPIPAKVELPKLEEIPAPPPAPVVEEFGKKRKDKKRFGDI